MQQLSKVKRQHQRLYLYILLVLILSSLIGLTSPAAVAANEYRAPMLLLEQAGDDCGNIPPVVTTTTELLNAINSANCKPSDDTINLQAGQDFVLTNAFDSEGNAGGNGLPAIGTAVTHGKLTINGNGARIVRLLTGPAFRILYVSPGADLTLNDVAIIGGLLSDNGGGGIYNRGTVTINHNTLGFNSALGAGGIYNQGTLTITDSVVFGNRTEATGNGAGIINTGTLTLRNSLFSGNSAGGNGGAIANIGGSTIVNSTFSGNQAASGGAIFNLTGGAIKMSYSTVAANSSGLLNIFGAVYLANSILADSTSGPDCVDVDFKGLVSSGVNIVENNSNCHLAGVLEADPQLGPLQENGGPTQTFALLPGSPAINTGTNTLNSAIFGATPTTDQRGLPRIVGGTVDIGAYEVADTDGITDAIENAAPHGGDGNQDGIRDSLQSYVVSFPNAVNGRYVTLVAPTGTEFVDVQANPAPADVPRGVNFPLGIVAYRLQRIPPGSTATVDVIDHSGATVTTYYQFGPTPGQPSPYWYEFVFDGSSGVDIVGNQISVNVVDGRRGDNDLTVNGEIAERGGLALLSNQPPVADSGFASTHEDIPVAITLSASDGNSDPLTFTVANPTHGTLTGTPPHLTYTPNTDFHGSDSFTFTATDGTAVSNLATVTITVMSINDAPVAADDSGSLNEDTALNVPAPGVLLNDTDVDFDRLTAVLSSDPANGVLVLNGDGSFSYTPNPNFSGTDAFTYNACDIGNPTRRADDLCDAATVTITVTPVNDGPTAVIAAPTRDQLFTADPTGSATVTFNAAGSSDPDGSIVSYAWSWTGTSAGNATGGATAQAFGVGSYSLTLTVTDDATATDTETVNFSVQAAVPTNQAPIISPVADQTTKQGETIAPLTLNASDPDGDTLIFTVTNPPLGLSFTPTNRQISGTVDVNAITTTVTVSVSDGINPAVSLTFVWNISDDVAPTFTPINQTNTVGDVINLSLAAFASDPETPALRFDLTGGALPSGLSLATNGTVTGTISGSATGYTPTIRLTDSIGQTVSASFTWTVTASAGPTTATFQVNQATDDVNEVNTTYSANDPTMWIGNGGTANTSFLGVRFNGVTIPPGSTIQSATLQVYSTANQWISVSVQLAGQAADTSLTFSTGSRPSARPLTAARVTSTTNAQWLPSTWYDYPGLQSVVQEIVNRAGWQSGNSLSLIFRGLGPGSWGRKLITSYDGDPAHAPRLVISYAGGPPPPNQPPFVKLDNPAATAVAVEGQAATTITGTFGDPDNNPVTLTPSLGTLQINGNAWTWNYTPADGPVNTTVTISAKDSKGALASPPVTFNLNVSNVAPTAVFAAQPASTYVNNAVALTFSSPVDVAADLASLIYTVDCGNGSAIQTVAPFSCTYASVGTYTVLGTVTDKDGGSTTYSAIITVSSTPTAPTTITPQVNASSDDVNQTGNTLDVNKPQIWIGTEGNPAQSYTGLRFNNLGIPVGSTITEAHLEFYTTANTWINVDILIAADAADNSVTFSNGSKPSTRSFTTTRVTHHSNVQWLANSWNTLTGNLAGVVQEVVSRAGWQSGNSLSIILKGIGSQWARKFATSYEGNPAFAPRLVISYTPPAAAVTTTNDDPPVPLNQTIPNPPSAAFSAGLVTGDAPLAVQFTNASTGDIAGYAWNFGDGATSTDLNPAHTYTAAGSYTVTLIVTGTDTTTSTAQVAITVTTPVVVSTDTPPPPTATPTPTDIPTDVPVVTTPPPTEEPTQPPDVAAATSPSADQAVSP